MRSGEEERCRGGADEDSDLLRAVTWSNWDAGPRHPSLAPFYFSLSPLKSSDNQNP